MFVLALRVLHDLIKLKLISCAWDKPVLSSASFRREHARSLTFKCSYTDTYVAMFARQEYHMNITLRFVFLAYT